MQWSSLSGVNHDDVVATTSVRPGPDALTETLERFRAATAAAPTRVTCAGPLLHTAGARCEVPVVSVAPDRGPVPDQAQVEIRGVSGASLLATYPMAGAVLTRSRGAVRGLPTSLTADATPEPEVSGSTDDPEVFRRQVSRVFERFEEVLAASGLCPRHITRTWFFIDRIHDRYPIFNEVRDAYFDAWDLRGFPASTGIGAALQAGVGIVGALDALDGAEVREVNTVHQPAPRSYGPRFVRANTFDLDGLRVLNISGISSIDDQGRSLATGGDDELDHCLGSFVDLLSGAGMTPQDVRSLYLYASAPEVGRRLVTRARGLGLPEPTLVNYSDICRPDLRVEIEGRAVRPVL